MRMLVLMMLVLLPFAAQAGTPQKAIFAGGCFWCLESELEATPGVMSVVSGYTGGTVKDPTYEQVSSGGTGHAEAVEVTFDPDKVSYEQLLSIYWSNIDPTDEKGQFADRGSQYRTVIFVAADGSQTEAAKTSLEKQQAKFGGKVKTTIEPVQTFYAAETYHQDYAKNNPVHYNAYKYGSGRVSRLKALNAK